MESAGPQEFVGVGQTAFGPLSWELGAVKGPKTSHFQARNGGRSDTNFLNTGRIKVLVTQLEAGGGGLAGA